MKLHILYIIILWSNLNAFSQYKIQNACNSFINDKALEGASIGFMAIDAKTGSIIAKHNENSNLIPASTLKLVTTGAALDILGVDYRFKTSIAYKGKIDNGTLNGDIIIKAGGDPALGSKYFNNHPDYYKFIEKWANSIKQYGIKDISGKIIVDMSIYDSEVIPNTWIWEDLGNYYGAAIYALSAYDNICTLYFNSPSSANKQTKITKIEPELQFIKFENQVLSSDVNKDKAFVFGSPLDSYRVIRGTIPKGRDNFKIKASLPETPRVVAYQLKQELNKIGVKISDIDLSYSTINNTFEIYQTVSPRLSQIINVTNYESVNLFAEHLVKQIAYKVNGKGSFTDGLEIIKKYWNQKNIDFQFIEDGSGLSRSNAITAKQMCSMLYSIKRNNNLSNDFFYSLPTVPNGTLWYFNLSLFPNSSLKAKSGSLTRVRCFSGELINNEGKHILFTIMVNNFSCSQSLLINKIQNLLFSIKSTN